jgi:hypothetical protein
MMLGEPALKVSAMSAKVVSFLAGVVSVLMIYPVKTPKLASIVPSDWQVMEQ